MIKRDYWLKQIQALWKHRSIIWLSGVRRAGKTFLCKSLPGVLYFDCELPSVRRQMEDPESFLGEHRGKTMVIDEIHRLAEPSQLLKIAADHCSETKIIATGSSSLGATAKFKDTLTGRKLELWLTPMISQDLSDFGMGSLKKRLHNGGLPPFFMMEKPSEKEFEEWIESYWAKDILELFKLERRFSFLKFMELLFVQSGHIFEATSFTVPCEISRTTVHNYLSVLEATYVFHIIRPYNTHKQSEIVSAPKVYAFDTGFVCHYKQWAELRNEDLGYLWEHYVLNEIFGRLQTRKVNYWRDKQGHEIDFVINAGAKQVITIECKWKSDGFDAGNLRIFRSKYPFGNNYVAASDVTASFTRKYGDISVKFVSLNALIGELHDKKI